MHRHSLVAALIVLSSASSAFAQRFPFERTVDTGGIAVLDVLTDRGKIDVAVGEPGRIVVRGAATVRVGLNVPSNAVELARRIAGNPPVERDGRILRLRLPRDEAELRAMTISYQVEVPPDTEVRTVSESGAITVRGAGGAVTVRTQSSAIDVTRVGAGADITTGSGAVTVDGVAGALTVITSSSGITLRALGGNARIRTQSGAVDAAFTGEGEVDVETGSSAIKLRNLRGGLKVSTESGRVTADGAPTRAWEVSTGSGSVDITATSAIDVDASNRSGTIEVNGTPVKGTISKRRVAGTVGPGGPLVRVVTRSGSIHITAPAT